MELQSGGCQHKEKPGSVENPATAEQLRQEHATDHKAHFRVIKLKYSLY